MKYFITIACAVTFLSACNKTGKALQEKIINSDSVAINFFRGDGTMDTVVAVEIIRDKAMVEKLSALITATSAELKNNCGYDGSIHYFKNNSVIQDIDFRMQLDQCTQFTFMLQGKKQATGLSEQARTFLSSLKK